uniref:Uncharacterized protein n=1 Tax=Musa acuminata subsp. malaccensis TaxID=214687 RepID=A0A804HXZ9_MUSAM
MTVIKIVQSQGVIGSLCTISKIKKINHSQHIYPR